MKDRINIVFASDDRYVQHAAVAMTSILTHTSKTNLITFYLLADNITHEKIDRVQRTVERFGSTLIVVEVKATDFQKVFVSGRLSRTAYFRLKMPELLPLEVEKAIYLDCDLILYEDIYTLWQFDLNNHPIGAIADLGIMASRKDWKRKQKQLGFKANDKYFNSGVLVVDLNQWRTFEYGKKAEILALSHDYQHHDQDVLNYLFIHKWQELPMQWNVIPPVWNMFFKILVKKKFRDIALMARRHIAILHYAGGYKPWEYPEIKKFNYEYYKSLRKSAFSDVSMPQLSRSSKGKSIKRQLLRLWLADLWQKIFFKKGFVC